MLKYVYTIVMIMLVSINYAQQTPSNQLIEKGIKLHDEEKYSEAIKIYLLVHENDSNYSRMTAEAALSYLQMGKYDSAVYYAQLGLSIPGSTHSNIYVTNGSALDEMGKSKEAIEIYHEAIEQYPYSYLLYFNLGVTLMNAGQIKEAEESFKNALSCNPFHASSHLALGKIMARQKQYTKAFLALETFLAIEPNSNRSNRTVVYLENLSNNYLDTIYGSYLDPFSDNSLFVETDHYIRAKIALSNRYQLKVDFNASIVKQTQMLLEVLPYDSITDQFWAKMYFPFFLAIKDGDYFEPFIYTILRSTDNEKVTKYHDKNEKELSEFYSTGGQLTNIRTKRLLNLEGEPIYYECDYYKGGSIYSIGNSNQNGDEKGLWLYFHPNEELKAKGHFIDGLKDGQWEYYNNYGQHVSTEHNTLGVLNGVYTKFNENGMMDYQVPYKENNVEGMVYWYDVFGNKTGESTFENDTRQGSAKNFYSSGEVKDSFTYKDGEVDGPYLSYYPDGKIMEESYYNIGLLEGENVGYFHNEKLSYKGNFKEGKREGEWFSYYNNGKLKSHGFYQVGLHTGEEKDYFHNGLIEKISQYNDKGEIHGVCKSYDLEGFLYMEEEYRNDIIIGITCFDTAGNIIESFGNNKGNFSFISYDVNGNKITSGSYVEGIPSGNWKTYFINGNTSTQYHLKDGLLDGEYKSYYSNGQLKSTSIYLEGQAEGYSFNYEKNGYKKSEGYFINGIQEGHWYYYNSDGSIDTYYYLEEGALSGWASSYAVDGQVKSKYKYLNGRFLQRLDYNKIGEVVDSIDFTSQTEAIIKSTPDIVIAKYRVESGLYEGDYTWYHPNGEVYSSKTFINDNSEGEYISYYENNQIRTKGILQGGKNVGKWTTLFENGNVRSELFYFDDELDSTCIRYFENGKVHSQENYYNGQLHGTTNLYDPEGELIIRLMYNLDEQIAYQYIQNDQLCTPIKIESPDQKIIAYFNNGKTSYIQRTKDYLPNGATELYSSDGLCFEKKGYSNGLLEGKYETYYQNGNLKLQTNYKDGLINGKQKEYRENGRLKSSVDYKIGQEHGKKEVYDEAGKLIRIENYWSGCFIGYEKIEE